MSVNVAAQQVAHRGFVDDVVRSLEDSGLEPGLLALELTETALLDDLDRAVERLGSLRALGVQVAIDDFGTGYSSLAYLARLPVDILKVDKVFVDSLCEEPSETTVTEAIFSMSSTLRLVSVAEGVELPEQAAWLETAACTLGQGFLWSRPVDLASAHALLHTGVPRQRAARLTPPGPAPVSRRGAGPVAARRGRRGPRSWTGPPADGRRRSPAWCGAGSCRTGSWAVPRPR